MAGAGRWSPAPAGSRPELVDGLRARGARVDEVELYEAVAEPRRAGRASRPPSEADYLTFTASSTVRAFLGLLSAGTASGCVRDGPRVVSIGPVTSATAREEGMEVHAEAAEHTIPGLVAALLADAGAPVG